MTLVIREAQMEAMVRRRADAFRHKLQRHLRALGVSAPEGELAAYAERVITGARTYGLYRFDDLTRFAKLVVAMGFSWGLREETRWMHKVMTDAGVPDPRQRLARLEMLQEHRHRVLEENHRAGERYLQRSRSA